MRTSTQTKKDGELRKRQDSCSPNPGADDLTLENCWRSASPQCYNALYNIPEPATPHLNNSFAIFEQAVSYVQSDMDQFFQQVAPQVPVGTVPQQILLNGAELDTNLTGINGLGILEAELDFQTAWPLVYPLNLTLLESTITVSQLPLLAGLNLSTSPGTSVSISYVLDNALSSLDAVSSNMVSKTASPANL